MDDQRIGKMVSLLEYHVAEVARLEKMAQTPRGMSLASERRLNRYKDEKQGMVIALHTLGVYEDVRRAFAFRTGIWLPSYEATLVAKALEGPTVGDEG